MQDVPNTAAGRSGIRDLMNGIEPSTGIRNYIEPSPPIPPRVALPVHLNMSRIQRFLSTHCKNHIDSPAESLVERRRRVVAEMREGSKNGRVPDERGLLVLKRGAGI